MRSLILALTLCAGVAAAALPQGEQVLKTRDGRTLTGVVLSETAQGYLFRTATATELILFSNIEDLQPAQTLPPVVPVDQAPPPPPPPLEQPNPAAAPPSPQAAEPSPQPPPPQEPPAAPEADWRAARAGFHFSVGLGGMVDPGWGSSSSSRTVAFSVAALPSVRWGFGWLDLSAELIPMGYFRGSVKAFFLAANPQLRINLARFFSLGVGLYGALVVSPSVDFALGPSLSPAIFRLGGEGQHELRLWLANLLIATSSQLRGNPLWLVSYAYVF